MRNIKLQSTRFQSQNISQLVRVVDPSETWAKIWSDKAELHVSLLHAERKVQPLISTRGYRKLNRSEVVVFPSESVRDIELAAISVAVR
jgi:hypothetical protein